MKELSKNKLKEIVETQLANESFGPEELARKMGMSHSGLYRKLKESTGKSISQFIREVRLEKAKELLLNEQLSVSEVAYQVGFSSPTYFNKCFHDFYKLTPGEYRRKDQQLEISQQHKWTKKRILKIVLYTLIPLIVFFVFLEFLDNKINLFVSNRGIEKSIAVRPFNYLGENSDKEYLANAIMLEILNQLSQLQDLRVMSSTSVLPYSDQTDKIIGKKINCSFILSGNLHVEENQMNLILSLVNTADESVVKAFNYKSELNDIIEIPGIVAQSVAKELHFELSKKEKYRIEKVPTLNLTAYDFFQRAREEHYRYWSDNDNAEALDIAKDYYNKALEYDSTFARAYTGLAMVYWNKNYWTDYLKDNFLDSVKILVDKAFSFDPELPEAYVMNGEYLRENHFYHEADYQYDKAIALNPNEWMAYWGKANLHYNNDALETIKNLHQVFSLNRGNLLSGIFERLFYAYLNAGFIQQAKHFVSEKVQFDEDSVQYYYLMGKSCIGKNETNFYKALEYFLKAYKWDSSHVYLLNSIGWRYDCLGQYDQSLIYYQKIVNIHDTQNNLFGTQINNLHRIGYSFYMNGDSVMADYYFDLQLKICTTAIKENRSYSDYLHYDLAGIQAFHGEKDKAYENLKIVAQKELFPHWFAVLIQIDPLFESLREEEEFENFVHDVQAKYSKEHERVKQWLEKQNNI